MADFTAPSFSLGLDFDFEQPAPLEESHFQPQEPEPTIDIVSSQSIEEDDIENYPPPKTLISDLQADDDDSPSLPILKRLKRGLSTKSVRLNTRCPLKLVDDEIEDISSPEDNNRDDQVVVQNCSSCSRSKFPLHGFIPLCTQCSKSKAKEREASNVSCFTRNNKTGFPKQTISPFRRFRLLDPDTDDPCSSEDLFEDSSEADDLFTSSSRKQSIKNKKLQSEDLWKDFGGENIPTPALDDFCEEYFRSSVKGKKNVEEEDISVVVVVGSKVCKNGELLNNNPVPPAYKYFYHDDPRIKCLVRQRLPNFCPLGGKSEAPDIDYMCQFEPTTSTWRRNKGKENDGSWVNPKAGGPTSSRKKSRAPWVGSPVFETPKNAGKRRVRAVGSSGSWFTGEDGRKVYVSKNGKELSGRLAYLQYRKESGAGFKKSRKKGGGASKKKSKR